MITPIELIAALESAGVSRWVGVPDSVLRGLCDTLCAQRAATHVITANEGAAVALAAGHHLATGQSAAVYLQNAGLGNALNPLMSLAHRDVYALPMWLVVGWRGALGVRDEPQHVPQGRIQRELLTLMDIPAVELSGDSDTLAREIASIASHTGPRALVVRPGVVASAAVANATLDVGLWTREQAIECVVSALGPDDAVVATTGMTGRELWSLRARENSSHERDFLNVGAMGHASALALGLALGRADRRVVLLDGDGALLMHLGTLATIGLQHPVNLTHIVLDNGVHDSVGAQPTGSWSLDLAAMARAAGYGDARSVRDAAGLREALGARCAGPRFVDVRVRPGHRGDLPRPDESLRALGERFGAWFRR